jgi:hypothetical protein
MSRAIAIDFDGTLCENKWPEIGEPNWNVINRAKAEKERGAELILLTMREGELLDKALAVCKEWGLTFDAVNDNLESWKQKFGNNPRKIGATEYWDDRAVNAGEIDSPHPFYVPKDSSFVKPEVSANFYKGTSDSALRDSINRSSHTDYSTSQISALWIAYHSGRVPAANKQIQKYESEDKQKQDETNKSIIIFLIIVAVIAVLFMILF